MKTETISCTIFYDDDEGRKIKLINSWSNGKEIVNDTTDLIPEFERIISENGNMGQVSYWISDKPQSKDDMLAGFFQKLFGKVNAEYDSVFQGSWTYQNHSCVGYNDNGILTVGGHDLFNELCDNEGKFLLMELNFGIEA